MARSPRDVRRMFVRRGLSLTAAGLVLGLAAALLLSRLLVTVLYGVGPSDPLTFGAVAAMLVVTAIAASWIPARRAARIDPVETLRAD